MENYKKKITLGDIFYFDETIGEVADYCNEKNLLMEEIESDEVGRRYIIKEMPIYEPTEDDLKIDHYEKLKKELEKIKEDIEQEAFGLVRDDYVEKKARAAEIVNELRILEGKEPRKIKKAFE